MISKAGINIGRNRFCEKENTIPDDLGDGCFFICLRDSYACDRLYILIKRNGKNAKFKMKTDMINNIVVPGQ